MNRLLPILAALVLSTVGTAQPYDLVIANGRVMDPETGLDAIRHLGIVDGTIQAISETLLEGREVIDATGHVVAPGFIDLNTYQHGDPFFRLRASDGVTAVLALEGGAVDIPAYYDAFEGRALIHYGAAVAHEYSRPIVQGDTNLVIENGMTESRSPKEMTDRALTSEERDSLATLIHEGLRQGAVAVGFGIAYSPGATHSEILQMFEIAAEYNASSHIHTRNFHETREWDDLNEVLVGAMYTGGDLHINHLQAVYGSVTERALTFVDRARSIGLSITAECYPYTAGMTTIESAPFDDWETRPEESFNRFEWPSTGERLTKETFGQYREQGGVIIIHARNEEAQEAAVRTCLAHPLPMIASDGAWDDGITHPRSAGTNSRVLGRYVREEGILTLMDALRKMSLDPANHLSRRVPEMRNKGRIQIGMDADIVVFNPETIIDQATYREPTLPPVGIPFVLIAGMPVVREGEIQNGVFPGRAIRGPLVLDL